MQGGGNSTLPAPGVKGFREEVAFESRLLCEQLQYRPWLAQQTWMGYSLLLWLLCLR